MNKIFYESTDGVILCADNKTEASEKLAEFNKRTGRKGHLQYKEVSEILPGANHIKDYFDKDLIVF